MVDINNEIKQKISRKNWDGLSIGEFKEIAIITEEGKIFKLNQLNFKDFWWVLKYCISLAEVSLDFLEEDIINPLSKR